MSLIFLTAATPFVASEFLKKYEKEFFDAVNAKHRVLKLKRCGVISPRVEKEIVEATDEDAKDILYDHLSSNASVGTLRNWCEEAMKASGFPKMQELGIKMKEALSPAQGGWLVLCECMGTIV